MITAEQFGPLARLVGTWEGNRGHDDSYSHDKSSANQNSYFERMTLSLEQAARSTTYRIDIDLSVDGVLARAVLCRSRARAVSAQRLHMCAVPPWHVGSRR